MEKSDGNADGTATPPDGEKVTGGNAPGDEKSVEPDNGDTSEKTQEDIVIKQVPVDGICGGY